MFTRSVITTPGDVIEMFTRSVITTPGDVIEGRREVTEIFLQMGYIHQLFPIKHFHISDAKRSPINTHIICLDNASSGKSETLTSEKSGRN